MRKLITLLLITISLTSVCQVKTKVEYGLKSIFTPTINSYEYKLNGSVIYLGIANDKSTAFGYDSNVLNNRDGGSYFGYQAGKSVTGSGPSGGTFNTLIGYSAGSLITTADFNTIIGGNSGNQLITGSRNTIIGAGAGGLLTGSGNILIGFNGGYNLNAISNRLIIHNSLTASEADDTTKSLIFGNFAQKKLTVNGEINAGERVKMVFNDNTNERCLCILVTAGEAITKGSICAYFQSGASLVVKKVPTSGNENDMPVGVAYTSASGNGVTFWLAVQGIVQVLPNSDITASQGFVIYTSSSESGKAMQSASALSPETHFKACGHWVKSGTGTGILTPAIIHFN
jgi:hypothetical protein